MDAPSGRDITAILQDVGAGRRSADDLLPLLYEQLRAIAQQRMAGERANHTLQATALVNEAYVRLAGTSGREVAWANRAHFYAAAAEAMRRILSEHARARGAVKRGGRAKNTITDLGNVADLALEKNPEEIMALDQAILRLEGEDARAADVVRLRFFAGLSIEHTALAMGVSERTVKRDWEFARAWLFRTLNEIDPH